MMAKRVIALAVLTFFVTHAAVFSATIEDYQVRVARASEAALKLDMVMHGENTDLVRETVAEIRRSVPASEKIALPEGEIDTDNKWLHTALDQFEHETDDAKRRLLIVEIGERLAGLAESVRALEVATAATRGKDEDKQKLAEILRRAEYQKPEPPEESLFQLWWRRFTEWLRDIWPRPNLSPGSGLDFSSVRIALQVVIFALVIALIGFIVWRLAPFLSARFGDRVKKKREERVILGERVGSDESAEDLFGEAEALARDGNLRGAIRKGYIAVLCELGDRKVVRLARHKTNRDYLRDVRKVESLFQNMNGLTQNFERTWYGLRVPEPQDWDEFRTMYRQTLSEPGKAVQ